MSTVKFIEISKGLKIGVPIDLTPEEIQERVDKYKNNLEKSKIQHYNPRKNKFVKSKF